MISPRVDRLLEHVDSPYASVIVAAKRARQINSYYHNLGEGTFEEFPPPMVDTGSKNYLTIALEEVASGKIKYRYRGRSMARILLGVSGGIAAYKALELTRLAMKAGHAVRVIQTEASTRFVGTASFAGITGAPVLVTEWERRPAARRVPRRPGARARAALAPRAGGARRRVRDRARVGQHDRQARRRTGRQPAHRGRARRRRPLIVAPAMNDAMYEHPATQANLETLRARGAGARARHRRARLAGGVGRRPAARARRAAGRRRGAPRRRRRRSSTA